MILFINKQTLHYKHKVHNYHRYEELTKNSTSNTEEYFYFCYLTPLYHPVLDTGSFDYLLFP